MPLDMVEIDRGANGRVLIQLLDAEALAALAYGDEEA